MTVRSQRTAIVDGGLGLRPLSSRARSSPPRRFARRGPRSRHDVLVAMDGRRHRSRDRGGRRARARAHRRAAVELSRRLDARAVQRCAHGTEPIELPAELVRLLAVASASMRRATAASIRRYGRWCAPGASTATSRRSDGGGIEAARAIVGLDKLELLDATHVRKTQPRARGRHGQHRPGLHGRPVGGPPRAARHHGLSGRNRRRARGSRREAGRLRRGESASKTRDGGASPAPRCACRRRAHGRHHERLLPALLRSGRPHGSATSSIRAAAGPSSTR